MISSLEHVFFPTNSISSLPSNSSLETITPRSFKLSINEHKKYISDTLNSWCENNKSQFNLSQFSLLEGQHYFISIQNDLDGVLKGNIKCCCEKWLSLTLRRGKFQMSNFYRHLQGLRNGNICNAMKEMIDNSQSTSSLSTNNQQPFTTSDNVPQQILSPNIVPTILPPVTVASISTSSKSSSISISTDDESIRKPSSSLVTKRQVKRKIQIIEPSYSTRESAKRTRRR